MTPRPHLATLLNDMRGLGQQTAVVEHRGVRRFRTSYAQLVSGAAWFATELMRRNIMPGERVILWGENSAAWIGCFFGCVHCGVLVVPLDATGTLSLAERVIRDTSPRLIVGDELLLLSLDEAVLPRVTLAEVDTFMRGSTAGVLPTAAGELGPDTPLQIVYTSGTTNEPKGIVHTHRNLLASLTPIEREIAKYRRYERLVHPLHILHTLPLSHVFGQFMGLWVAPVLGAVVHYESRLEAGRLLRLIRQEHISVLAAVPRVLTLLSTELLSTYPQLRAQLEHAKAMPLPKRWWHFRRMHQLLGYRFWAIVCGGATLPGPLESFWTTLGVALIQGYGMTETSALVTLNHPFKPARGTLGSPLPGRELRISGEGELLVRGEMVATATWHNGAMHHAPDDLDGDGRWLATGDLATRDEQGRLHYLGRTGQRLVTSAGLNVYLQDVEAALAAQQGVDAAVALTIEGALGPEPAAVVQAADGAIARQAVIYANASMAQHQRVTQWWLWPELALPRTATGKVRRHVVEAWAFEQLRLEADRQDPSVGEPAGAGGDTTTSQDPLLRLISEITGGFRHATEPLGVEAREHLTLESIGLDSLARVQLQSSLERALGRTIEDRQMAAVRTLGDLRRAAGIAAPQVSGVAGSHHQAEAGDVSSDMSTYSRNVQEPFGSKAGKTTITGYGSPEAKGDSQRLRAREPQPPTLPRRNTFLYLRWPWAAPVQLLRTLFLEACVRPLVGLLASPTVTYARPASRHEPVTLKGPILIVSNHVSSYDVPLLLYALPTSLRRRVAVAAAGEMLEDWRHACHNPCGPAIFWLLTLLFNVFPLPRSSSFRHAFAHAGQALDRAYSVLVFPEGARAHGAAMRPFQGGIGLLAQDAAVQVLPVGLTQSRMGKSAGSRKLRPFAAEIRIGELITIHAGEDAHTITKRLQGAVKNLVSAPSSG